MRKTRKCAFCGKEFTCNSGSQRYCSEHCAEAAKAQRKKRQQDFLKAVQPVIDIARGGKGSAQEEATGLFEGSPACYRHRQPGVSYILQGCHPHGVFSPVRLQIGKRGETACITNQQPDGIRSQGRHREDACRQSLS